MKLFLLIISFLIISCGKKAPNEIVLPANQSTPHEAAIISRVLDKIQLDLSSLGVSVNVRSIPYVVTTLDNDVAGYCMYRGDGSPVGIAVSHAVIEDWEIETEDDYGLIYKVLLHEIGHCFIQRGHDDDLFTVPGFFMDIGFKDYETELRSHVPVSVMNDSGHLPSIPKSMWIYYVKEMLETDRVESLEDLRRYVSVELRAMGY